MAIMYHNYHYCVCSLSLLLYTYTDIDIFINTLQDSYRRSKVVGDWWYNSHYPEVSTASYKPNKNPFHLVTDVNVRNIMFCDSNDTRVIFILITYSYNSLI